MKNWDEIFATIEDHFGFKLHDWQKDYISMKILNIPVDGRRNGKTFAFVLRRLLNYDPIFVTDHKDMFHTIRKCKQFPCDRYWPVPYVVDWYPKYIIKLDSELKSIGLDTCFVFKEGE